MHCRPGADVATVDGSFVVCLARSGLTVQVGREESILAALGRIGVRVPSSCTAGTCGTCETGVLAGIPHHRDQLIARSGPESVKSIMVCCSRSLTPELTLDL